MIVKAALEKLQNIEGGQFAEFFKQMLASMKIMDVKQATVVLEYITDIDEVNDGEYLPTITVTLTKVEK